MHSVAKQLMDTIAKLPPEVKANIKSIPKNDNPEYHLLHYLHTLFLKDSQAYDLGQEVHKLQVELYAKYIDDKNDPSLMTFLRTSNYYPLPECNCCFPIIFNFRTGHDICEKYAKYPQQAYILVRMGNSSQALKLYMTKIEDIKSVFIF